MLKDLPHPVFSFVCFHNVLTNITGYWIFNQYYKKQKLLITDMTKGKIFPCIVRMLLEALKVSSIKGIYNNIWKKLAKLCQFCVPIEIKNRRKQAYFCAHFCSVMFVKIWVVYILDFISYVLVFRNLICFFLCWLFYLFRGAL